MVAPGPERKSHRLATGAICVLLALVALAFVATSFTPTHTHASSTAGLYNAECPLAELAARHDPGSLPPAPPSCWSDFTPAGALLFAAGGISAPVVLAAESRAPPLA
jgi:hypothetical protein